MKNKTVIISENRLGLQGYGLKTYNLYRADGLREKHASGKMIPARGMPEAKELLSLMADSLGLSFCENDINNLIEGENGLYLWVDGTACAIARISFTDGKFARINTVFTHPEKRGNGYAGALVCSLAQKIISDGFIPTVLADEENPISNKMYQSLGFENSGKVYEYSKKDAPKKECAILNFNGKRN